MFVGAVGGAVIVDGDPGAGAFALSNVENVFVQDGASLDLGAVATSFSQLRSLSRANGGVEIHGTGGNDAITGGVGLDTLDGGAGDDRIQLSGNVALADGGAGADLLVLNASRGGTFAFDDSNYAGFESVLVRAGVTADFSGVTSALLVITASRDGSITTVTGSGAADRLAGSTGIDHIAGGGGADGLSGGRGADVFVYGSLAEMGAGNEVDRITDFSHADGDTIDLSAIDPDAALDDDQSFTFIGTNAFTGAGGADYEVRVKEGANGGAFLQFDVNHDGIVDAQIFVAHDAPFTAGDFVL